MSEAATPTRRRVGVRNEPLRQLDEAAFILHSTPYRETSLIVQAFSRFHGRIALIAKGAKRPTSQLRLVLMSMQPLLLSWSGRGEVKTLTQAQWAGGLVAPKGRGLLCGFYINELLLRLTAREDPHVGLYDAYVHALTGLADSAMPYERVLRRFEAALLAEIGVGPDWTTCADEQPVRAEGRYVVIPEFGVRPRRQTDDADVPVVDGQVLLDIDAGDFSSARTLQQSKPLMRSLINHALAGRQLATRQILIDLHAL